MKRSGTTTDEDIRSSPLGFFNVAESYWAGAAALERAELKTTHPNSPISFLYYHAIELYLKAFLRLHGHSAKELRGKKFGHNTCCLSERAVARGLRFDDEDLQVLSLMAMHGRSYSITIHPNRIFSLTRTGRFGRHLQKSAAICWSSIEESEFTGAHLKPRRRLRKAGEHLPLRKSGLRGVAAGDNPTRLKQNWPSDIPLPEVRLVYRWSPRFGRRPLTISFMRKRKLP